MDNEPIQNEPITEPVENQQSNKKPRKKYKKANRLLVAQYLAEGNSQVDAANQFGIDKDTVNKWFKDPEFNDLVERCTNEIHREAQSKLAKRIQAAWDLVDRALLAKNDDKIPTTSLNAALAILRTAGAIRDYVKPMGNGTDETPEVIVGEPIKTQDGTPDEINPQNEDDEEDYEQPGDDLLEKENEE